MEIELEHVSELSELDFEYYFVESEILEYLERMHDVVNNLEKLCNDLLSFVMFCFPLLIGVVIGLVAMKSFWDGASRW